MNINDFLKVKKVRCVNNGGLSHLTEGKEYEIKSIDYISVSDNDGDKTCVDTDWFEPVIDEPKSEKEIDTSADSVDNSQASLVDNADNSQAPHLSSPSNNDAPHVKPKFKVGDKVYTGIDEEIKVITQVKEKFVVAPSIPFLDTHYPISEVCHATPENHALLCKLYPHIEFEQPPTQADIDNEAVDKLAQAMKDKLAKKREEGYGGWDKPHCTNGNLSDFLRIHVKKGDPVDVANFCAFLFARGSEILQKPF